jgi:hypothetical protein
MAVTKITDLSGLFNEIYEDAVFVARDNNLMSQLVTVFPRQSGYADRNVGIWAQSEVLEVGDGVDFVTNKKFSQSLKASFTPTEKMAQFIVTDAMVETAQGRQQTRIDAANELGFGMAEKIDKDLLEVFADFDVSKGSAGSAATIAHFAAAQAVIRKNKARGQVTNVLHPYHWYDLWVELGQPVATKVLLGDVANQALMDYFVSMYNGGIWYISDNIEIDASDDAISGVFVREALALDPRKEVNFEDERDASLRGWELNVHAGYAVGTLWADRGAKVTADATEPTG